MNKRTLSSPVRRTDFDDKVSGAAKYCADVEIPGMLYARTLRSKFPRAIIESIELPPLPDGYFTVDHTDVKGRNRMPVGLCDMPYFAENRVNYVGEPILLIVGPDRNLLESLIKATRVSYRTENPILSIDDAERRKSEKVFGDSPIFAEYEYSKGDWQKASLSAAFSIEDEFSTGYQEHAYLETQSMIGTYENGIISVLGSMQCPYMIKTAVKEALGCTEEDVRVVQLPTGGGFGGKEEYPSILGVQVGVAAMKAGKPVKLIFDRKEDISSTTKRHPSVIKIRSFLNAQGDILARDIDIRIDAGAYSGLSSVVLQRCCFAAGGVYDIGNLRVHGRAIATNNIVSGAFRGFGGPQAFFAMEMHMEHIAKTLNIEPSEYKRRFFLKQGDTSSTGGRLINDIKIDEITDSVLNRSGYNKKRAAYGLAQETNLSKGSSLNCPMKGIGFSVFFHGCGFTGSGERDVLKAKASLRKHPDGKVEILVSSTELGQGALTTLRKIVSERAGIPLASVVISYPDTAICPDSGPTVASRTTMIVGRILSDCAEEVKRRWNEPEFTVTLPYVYPKDIDWDQSALSGNAYPEYSWGANVIEVEVNQITLEIRVIGIWTAFDIGEPIDERIVSGQIDGGMAQGIGYASMENIISQNGRILQDTLTTYAVPTSMDLPRVDNILIKNPYPDGPFGAKGLGELPLIGAAPALAAAVEQAVGKRIDRIPLTPEYLLKLLHSEMDNDG